MYNLTPQLLSHLASTLKIGDSEPKCLIRVFDPFNPDLTHDFHELNTEVMSIEVDRRWDMIASEASFRLYDKLGMYSPDYHSDKFLPEIQLPKQNNTYRYVFWPNTKVEIYLGYGSVADAYLYFTGLIDRVEIDSTSKILDVKCRGMTKDLLTTVIEPFNRAGKYEYFNWIASDVFADMVTRLGLTVDYDTTKYYDSQLAKEVEYYCPVVTFKFGELYGDALQKFVETLYHRMYDTRWGHVKLEQIILKTQDDIEDYVYNDTVNIQNLNYTIDDQEIRSHIRIVGPGGVDTFVNDYMAQEICKGKRRLASYSIPWADNTEKRKIAAQNYFTQMMRKFRKITFGAPANPALDIGDLIKMRDLVSTATAKYQVIGIRTSFTDKGFFDIIDVEYASNLAAVKFDFTNDQIERIEKVVFEQTFYTNKLWSNWNATFDPTNSHPWKTVLSKIPNSSKTWGCFVSGNAGPIEQGEESDAIFDINIPDNGFDYELQFSYCVDGNTTDSMHLIINGAEPIIVHGYVPWRRSARHKLKPGANRVVFRFRKNDTPQKSSTGASYSRLMINNVYVFKIGYR